MAKRRKGHPRGQNAGRQLSPAQQEGIVQTYAVTNSIRETARQCRITEKTARKYINLVPQSEIAKARLGAQKKLAGKIHRQAEAIIDSIKPEDLESGRIPIYGTADPETGERPVVGYRNFGPTLMQKVTSAAILTDKLQVLSNMESALRDGSESGELLVPQDIKALVAGIRGKVKSLTVLNLKFAEENPDLSQRVQSKLAEAEALADAKEADAEVLDFDNPEEADYETVPNSDTEEL